jgi:hypothetical protein
LTTSTGNKTLSLIEQLFYTLVWQPGVTAGVLALDVAVPALNLPVVHQIEDVVLDQLSSWLYAQFVMYIDVTTIKLQNQAHQSAYEQASVNLITVAQANGVNSQEYQDAEAQELANLSKFTSIIG